MMRIGIDAHGVGGHSLGLGNESYFKYLIKGLLEIDDTNEYHVFVNHPEELAAIVAGRPNVRLVALWPPTQWAQRPFSLPIYAARHRLHVVHCPFIRPPVVPARTVVTVHDACFEELPQHFRRHEVWRMKLLVPRSCKRSDLIFTVSEYAREQLRRLYDIPSEKIVVTYNGADHTGPRECGPWPAPWGLEQTPYVLYVGLLQPRKNLRRLLTAFERLRDRGLPHHLVLAGRSGWGNEDLLAAVARSPHRTAIHLPGYVRHDQFATLMSNAAAFAFPSEFESFGIPPMEAQRWGVPALVSANTCFPEIYGESVAYCNPLEVESIAAALFRLLTDDALRAQLRAGGLERSGRYTWRATAAIALRAYERLHAARRGAVA
jgi:glycosyltransferase involved in cell wall biosynthesis